LADFDGLSLDDVNQQGLLDDYPIHVAAVRGALDDLVALIAGGANVNAVGEDGNSAFHYAASFGYPDIVRLLLEHRSATNIKNMFGETPLDCAKSSGSEKVVELFAKTES